MSFDEWKHIEWMRGQIQPSASVPVGIGDDCAIITLAGRQALLKVDMLVEGIHFDLATASPVQVGRKAMNVNLSDIAAMAGRPTHAVVAVALPASGSDELPRQLFRGLKEAADRFDVAIVGGDTNRSKGGLVISVTVLGEIHPKGPLLRSAAKPADAILVTGELGYSLDGKHLDFIPRLREAQRLHERYTIHAMMDISDGIGGDLFHITDESRCGAILDADSLPMRTPIHPMIDNRTKIDHALNDGEDFELLFTAPADQADAILRDQPLADFSLHITRIGHITSDPAILLQKTSPGETHPLPRTGYTHRF